MKRNLAITISIFVTLFTVSLNCNSSHKLLKQADESGNYTLLKGIAKSRVNKKPKDSYALAMLGKAYQTEGKPDSAVYFYENAFSNNPEQAEYRVGLINAKITLGDTLLNNGYSIKARDYYLSAVDLDSTHFLALCRIGLVSRKLGKFDQGQAFYRKAYRINPYADSLQKVLDFFDAAHVQSNLLMRKGIEALKNEQFKEAMESLNQAIQAKPDNEEAKYNSHLANGLYYYKKGSVGELWDAIENFGLASSIKPNAAEPHFYMAEAYIKKDDKDFENAISEYEKVLELSPDSDLAKEARKKIKELRARDKLLKDFWNKK